MTAPSHARPPGEATLVGSWRALAATSRDAVVRDLHGSAVAIFPAWMPLNNAILLDPPTARTAAAAAAALDCEYRAAGVPQWALWLPSARGTFQGTDVVSAITGMTRDTTTVVMTAAVESGLARSPAVLKTSIAAATRASDEPTSVADLDEPLYAGLGFNAVGRYEEWIVTADG